MKINGFLSWVTFVYPDGRAYLTNLCKFISGFRHNLETRHPGHQVFSDLRWWSAQLSTASVSRSLIARGDPIDMGFWMDASSNWGISLMCKGRWAAWKWLEGWRSEQREIGWAEGVAVELAVRLLDARNISDVHVLIRTDNQGVMGAFQRGRGRNPEINNSIRRVDVICSSRNIMLSLIYVASADNLADPISRGIPGPPDSHLENIELPVKLSPFMVRVHG